MRCHAELQCTKAKLTDIQKQLQDSNSSLKMSEACNSELRQRLQDCKKTLQGNEQIIRWLNMKVRSQDG